MPSEGSGPSSVHTLIILALGDLSTHRRSPNQWRRTVAGVKGRMVSEKLEHRLTLEADGGTLQEGRVQRDPLPWDSVKFPVT